MADSPALGQNVPDLKPEPSGLYLMDGIAGLRSLTEHSVDMLLTDSPYGTTRNYWDVPLPLPQEPVYGIFERPPRSAEKDGEHSGILPKAPPLQSAV